MAAEELEKAAEKEGRAVITLDSSAVFAMLNRRDPDHRRVKSVLEQDRGPYLIPAAILGEIAYLVEERLGDNVMDLFHNPERDRTHYSARIRIRLQTYRNEEAPRVSTVRVSFFCSSIACSWL